MSHRQILLATIGGLLGALALTGLYVLITTLGGARDPWALAWEQRMSLFPLAIGFGVQVGIYVFIRGGGPSPLQLLTGRATTGASGGMSTVGMIACCAASLPNLLPLLGFAALTSALAEWKTPLMMAGVATNVLGIGIMVFTVLRYRRKRSALPAWGVQAEVL
jgi:hypothetical protein